jgi:ribosomal protein S18 acetylase RimI-like enzyme
MTAAPALATVRTLHAADVTQVTALLAAAFPEDFPTARERQAMQRALSLQARLLGGPWRRLVTALTGPFAVFVAEQDDRVLGCVAVSGMPPVVSNLAVCPAHRRRGIGRALLAAAEAFAVAHGAERVLLDVRADNAPAVSLYMATGYRVFHRYTAFERDAAGAGAVLPRGYRLVPVRTRHAAAFAAIEARALPAGLRAVTPCLRRRYTDGPPAVLAQLLGGARIYRRVLLRWGRVAGFALAHAVRGHRQGRIAYPLLPPEENAALPGVLSAATAFIARSGCATARLDLSDARTDQQATAEAHGWRRAAVFLQMDKHLARAVTIPVRVGPTG